ncbi:MAG: LEA type 2 family protein [Gammaproteobacteria bacterium]|nr:LEA type 2 family protein [Gammaproteobacteria bacterium]
MSRRIAVIGLVLWTLTAAGCTALLHKPEPPRVMLSAIQLHEMTLFEQRYQLQLRVQNPNDFDLPIDGLRCTLYLNEREFAQGVGAAGVTVPRFGEALLAVDVVSNLQRVFEQLSGEQSRGAGRGSVKPVSYRLTGTLAVAGYPTALPFEYKGEFDLRGLQQPAP